ncbi:hypothetical protein BpHYR1_009858 [Brachionus plicatilis]|uniref:Uncharacterized protein n=1 Tax=Brachionus plicatilis TaxID=10195 RepID=A0A3M7SE51_BRAPC|nr:hypothetical protein BpHYR1_009858 [Brachionus plicatilis]
MYFRFCIYLKYFIYSKMARRYVHLNFNFRNSITIQFNLNRSERISCTSYTIGHKTIFNDTKWKLEKKLKKNDWEAKNLKQLENKIRTCLSNMDLMVAQDHAKTVRSRLDIMRRHGEGLYFGITLLTLVKPPEDEKYLAVSVPLVSFSAAFGLTISRP